jgi:hypothetical protein
MLMVTLWEMLWVKWLGTLLEGVQEVEVAGALWVIESEIM